VLAWKGLSDFDLALRLVDFSGLRPVLGAAAGLEIGARLGAFFDPVSFFLLTAWQIANRWERNQCLQNLAECALCDYAVWFGFHKGIYPTEGGVRYFLTALGRNSEANHESVSVEQGQEIVRVEVQKLNLLLVEALGVMRQVPVLSPQAWQAALLCPDGQIHDAASQVRCISVSESCYLPLPQKPPALPGQRQRTAWL